LLAGSLAAAGLLLVAVGVGAQPPPGLPAWTAPPVILRATLHDLFTDEDIYTRDLVVSICAELPDVDATCAALVANQQAIASVLEPYYGPGKTAQFQQLMTAYTNHLRQFAHALRRGTGQADLLRATINGDADALASLLNGWNAGYYNNQDIDSRLRGHAVYVQREVQARMHGDWSGDLYNVDLDRAQMTQLADVIARGVVLQFPDRFALGAAPAPAPVAVAVVVMTNDNTFTPQVVTVSPGTTIRWDNHSNLTHTVSADTMNHLPGGPLSDADSPTGIAPGNSYTWQVPFTANPGDHWYYHDRLKGKGGSGIGIGPIMAGEIIVQ
jgi:plastocyanin